MRVLDLIAPPRCLGCRGPRGDPLCAACRAAMPWLRDACPRCALPRPCSPCPARRAAFDRAWAPVEHGGVARELVLALKLRGSRAAADAMAAMMAAQASRDAVGGALLVGVPPAPERLRRRGFDPAALIAARLSARAGVPLRSCLARPRGDVRQVGRARGSRRGGPTIEVAGPVPDVVLLVDDVHTTGSTLEACARALKERGSRQVLALSFARTLRGT